jgi:hypothetical protein
LKTPITEQIRWAKLKAIFYILFPIKFAENVVRWRPVLPASPQLPPNIFVGNWDLVIPLDKIDFGKNIATIQAI